MKLKMKLFLFVCLAAQTIAAKTDLPRPCHANNPDFKRCLAKYFNKLIPLMFTGVPEYKIPVVDPLEVPIIVVNRTVSESITISGILKHLKVLGLSQVIIDDLKVDVPNLVLELKLTHPHVYMTVEYKLNGQLGFTPLDGQGYLKGNFTDIKHDLKLSLKPYKKGVKYFRLNQFQFKSRIGGASVKLSAKDPEQQPVVDFLERLFNEQTRETLDLLNPYYVEHAGDVFQSIMNQALSKIPADELLPE